MDLRRSSPVDHRIRKTAGTLGPRLQRLQEQIHQAPDVARTVRDIQIQQARSGTEDENFEFAVSAGKTESSEDEEDGEDSQDHVVWI